MSLIPCQNCHQQLPASWNFVRCTTCGFRVCPACLPKHSGPYGNGGYKCSQCIHGQMKQG